MKEELIFKLILDVLQLGLLVVSLFLFEKNNSPLKFSFDLSSSTNNTENAEEINSTSRTIGRHFFKFFRWLWFCWILFYSIRILQHLVPLNLPNLLLLQIENDTFQYLEIEQLRKVVWNFLQNALNNISAFLVLMCYLGLSIPFFQNEWRKNKLYRINRAGWLFIFSGFIMFEFIFTLNSHLNGKLNPDQIELFSYLSGLLMSLSLFLFVGRLDSNIIKKELRERSNRNGNSNQIIWSYLLSKHFYNIALVLLYLYAAIQTLYPYFSSGEFPLFGHALAFFAMMMKFILLLLLYSLWLSYDDENSKDGQEKKAKTKVLIKYYDAIRDLHYHVRTEYKHQFLKTKFPDLYKSKHIKPGEGYLGIEYIRMSENDVRKCGYGEEDALLVTIAHHNSGARRAGIRPGDAIIRIDNQKLTAYYTLGKLLRDFEVGDTVLLDVVNSKGRTKKEVELVYENSVLPEEIDELNRVFPEWAYSEELLPQVNRRHKFGSMDNLMSVGSWQDHKFKMAYLVNELFPGKSFVRNILTDNKQTEANLIAQLHSYGDLFHRIEDSYKFYFPFKNVKPNESGQHEIADSTAKRDTSKEKNAGQYIWTDLIINVFQEKLKQRDSIKLIFNDKCAQFLNDISYSKSVNIELLYKNFEKDKYYFAISDDSYRIIKFYEFFREWELDFCWPCETNMNFKLLGNSNINILIFVPRKVLNPIIFECKDRHSRISFDFEKLNNHNFYGFKFSLMPINQGVGNTIFKIQNLSTSIRFRIIKKIKRKSVLDLISQYEDVFMRGHWFKFKKSLKGLNEMLIFGQGNFIFSPEFFDGFKAKNRKSNLKIFLFNERNQIIFKYSLFIEEGQEGISIPFYNASKHLGRKKMVIYSPCVGKITGLEVEIKLINQTKNNDN